MKTKCRTLIFYFRLLSRGFQLSLLLSIFTLVGCAPVTKVSTDTSPSPTLAVRPSPVVTSSPTSSAVPNLTPTPDFVDFRDGLLSGPYIAYWSQNTWYVKGLDGSSSMQLVTKITSELNTDIQPSPDGNLVAFSNTAGQLSISDLRTGELTSYSNPNVNGIYEFEWVPDSSTLLYLGTPEELWIPDSYVGIYGISLVSKQMFTVFDWNNDMFEYGLSDMSISPDGRWLAFSTPRLSEMMAPDPKYAIYLMDTSCLQRPETCNESMRLVGDGHDPIWSSDGMLGWVCAEGTESALCVMDISALTQPQVILTTSDLKVSTDANFVDFSWSPDRNYIALTLQMHQSAKTSDVTKEVILIPMNGGQLIKITNSLVNEQWEGWSPDSRYLAYSQVLGYTEPYGEIGARSPITNLYVYDIQSGKKIDLIDIPNDREVFGFFMDIK